VKPPVARAGRRPPVVLYQPRDVGVWMPLGLVAVGSGLADENVVIVDGRFELAPEARVAELAEHAACLAVSVRTGPPLRDALRVSAAARAVNPRLTILWGGAHATLSPQSCLATAPVDACVRGAGDGALAAVLEAIRSGRDLGGIPGVAVSGAQLPAPQPSPAPERLPRADYSLLDIERQFEVRGARRLDYCSSRGARDSGTWSGLQPERVVAELGELADRHGASEVLFQDEDFFADPVRGEAVGAGLAAVAPRLGWRATLRIDDVLEGGHDRLRLLVASGCRGLQLAVPPGVPARGGLRERALDAAALLHAAGLSARFEIELVSPGPKAEGLQHAISLARSICALDGRFETPLRRTLDLTEPPGGGASLEAWMAHIAAPWPDARAEARLARASFFIREAQRPPGRRLGQHLLRTLSLLRVRLGFFALDVERAAVEASAILRTGRPRAPRRAD
jgi:anaerobic magnesium-protoporphyrin IX monomethyl ester cyclase